MLNTLSNSVDFSISDSTVLVNGATIRVGNKALDFQGSNITFTEMSAFEGDTSSYQRALLFVQEVDNQADMTSAVSSTTDSTLALTYPELPTDATNPYSPVYPIGQFTLYSSDGTQASLVSYNKIV